MRIHGGIVDPAYSRMLIQKTDLSFDEIFALGPAQKMLSDGLDTVQKENKIRNLLTNMRRAGKIQNRASRKTPKWKLQNKCRIKRINECNIPISLVDAKTAFLALTHRFVVSCAA
jgi:hypothetical protein